MKQTFSYSEKIRSFFMILLPVLATQLSLEAIPFFGTIMAGQASPQDLVGVAAGSSLWVPVFVGLCGILAAIVPLVAHLLGAQKHEKVAPTVIQGLYLAILLSGIVILIGFFLVPIILHYTQLEPKANDAALGYLKGIAWGVPFLFLYTVLRSFMDGLGMTQKTMWVTFSVIPINGFFNWVLIEGRLGFPAYGGAGAGWAATFTYIFLLGFALFMVATQKKLKAYPLLKNWPAPSLKAFKEQLAIGLPIGFAIFCEVSIFCVVTLLMSSYGTLIMAGHQSAMNFSGLLYMLPLSISNTLTIIIGYEVGAKRYQDANKYSIIGMTFAFAIGLFFTFGIYQYQDQVALLYSKDTSTLAEILKFMVYARFFLLVDAIAAPIQGILRGYKDVRVTFFLAIFSYWIVGVPVGWFLAHNTHWGPFGYWIGLVSGLAAGAIGLSIRLWFIRKKYKSISN